MMSLNVRVKSALLACAMVVSSNSFCTEMANPFAGIGASLVANQKAIAFSTLAVVLASLKVRLDTKPRGGYTFENWQQDVTDLMNSYNVFDTTSRATIINFIDKYFVGAKFKREETTTRTKNDDGSVVTLKGTRVVQKPAGLMGLLDSYVLMQAEGLTELITPMAALYLLVNDPYGFFAREKGKIAKVEKPSTANETNEKGQPQVIIVPQGKVQVITVPQGKVQVITETQASVQQ